MADQKTLKDLKPLNPRHIFVRPARGNDAVEFSKWAFANQGNEFDPTIVSRSIVVCAFSSKRKVMFMPVQRPFFLESIAPNPEASDGEKAIAMKEIVQMVVSECYRSGAGEIYFLASEPTAATFAEANGFEAVPFSLYRMRVKDLEPREKTE